MTYGYTQGGSFSSHKQALGFDAAASEQLRAEAAIKEQKRQARERAKQLLNDVQRKYELNKTSISHHEVEARRLIASVNKEIHDLHEVEITLNQLENKDHLAKRQTGDTGTQILDAKKHEAEEKKELSEDERLLKNIEAQIRTLQQKADDYKKHITDAMQQLQKLALQIKQLEGQESKGQGDANKMRAEIAHVQKEIDNKKRLIQAMDQKRMHEVAEVERGKSENVKYEIEIKRLESEIKANPLT